MHDVAHALQSFDVLPLEFPKEVVGGRQDQDVLLHDERSPNHSDRIKADKRRESYDSKACT